MQFNTSYLRDLEKHGLLLKMFPDQAVMPTIWLLGVFVSISIKTKEDIGTKIAKTIIYIHQNIT